MKRGAVCFSFLTVLIQDQSVLHIHSNRSPGEGRISCYSRLTDVFYLGKQSFVSQSLDEKSPNRGFNAKLNSSAVKTLMLMSHMLTLFKKHRQQNVELHLTSKLNRQSVYDLF